MKKLFVIAILSVSIFSYAGQWNKLTYINTPETKASKDSIISNKQDSIKNSYQLKINDSLSNKWIGIHLSLADSVFKQNLITDHQWQNVFYGVFDFRGALGSSFTFGGDITVLTENGNVKYPNHDYQPYNGLPYNIQSDQDGAIFSDKRTSDFFTAWTNWDLKILTLQLGIDYLEFGPARRNKLMWSGNEQIYRAQIDQSNGRYFGYDPEKLYQKAPVNYFGFEMEISWFKYQQYSGKLKHDKDKDKYFHTHRFEFDLPFKTTFGINETVIYGDAMETDSITRDLEPVYLLPFVPYFFAEHYNGDRDNMIMGIDLENSFLDNWTFYGELLLDDMKSPPKGFVDDSWWGNKWATTIGSEFNSKYRQQHFKWILEFTHIEPWVYTHSLGASHNFSNYGQTLGSSLGPNSQELFSSFGWQSPKKNFGAEISISDVKKDTTKGSNINDIHIDNIDRIDKTYLAEESTIHYTEIGAKLYAKLFKYIHIEAGMYNYFVDVNGIRYFGAFNVNY